MASERRSERAEVESSSAAVHPYGEQRRLKIGARSSRAGVISCLVAGNDRHHRHAHRDAEGDLRQDHA
ncbi:MAG TPA: hypothetical protein PLO07_07160, partial [Rubrivivax sp.]|nr:hypothetical protein [Rubrivivax sp.]